MRPTRSFYVLAVLVGLLALSKVACVSVNLGGSGPRFEEARTVTVPAARAVEVRTQNGAVTVRRGESSVVVVTAHLVAQSKERLEGTRVVVERQQGDGGLLVTVAWPGERALNNEACGFDLEVPEGTGAVNVTTSNGAVTLGSLSGAARVRTSNGRVSVAEHRGAVDVGTSNGAVELTDVVGDVEARTTNGKVEMAGVVGRVVAHTSNGAVRVGLAEGATGPVEVGTSNGAVDLTLPRTYSGRMPLATSNGSVRYPSGPAVHDVSAGKTYASFAIGESQAESKVATSNGAIDVHIGE